MAASSRAEIVVSRCSPGLEAGWLTITLGASGDRDLPAAEDRTICGRDRLLW